MRNTHLTDKEIFSLIINPKSAEGEICSHLEKCGLCQRRVKTLNDFTEAFQKHVKQDDINWELERQKILTSLSRHNKPSFLKWRWAAAFVFSILIFGSLLLFNTFQYKNEVLISERDLLEEIQIVTDFEGNNTFSDSILYLSGCEPEESSSFLNLFLIIEEEYNEKENFTDDILGVTFFRLRRHA